MLEKLDDALCAVMPPEVSKVYRENRQADDFKRAQLRKTIISECALSIEYSSHAIGKQFPNAYDLEEAIAHLGKALQAAKALEAE